MATNLRQRIGLYILVFGIQSLYLPLNHGLQEGVILDTRWDRHIPIWPVWIVPYSLATTIWLAGYAWAALRMEEHLYRALIGASVLTTVTAIVTFALYPTYVVRPVLVGDDWATAWLRLVYATDGAFNAFPSGHVYFTTIMTFFWSHWYPRWRWAWVGFCLVVVLSTLFTGRHYIPDVIGGAALAWVSCRVGLRFVRLGRIGARSDAGWRLFPG